MGIDIQYFMYGLIGIALLYVAVKILKWPIKILINGIVGVIILYVINIIGANLSTIGINYAFSIPINPITALISGFFGIPGIVVILIIIYFL